MSCSQEVYTSAFGTRKAIVCSCGFATTYTVLGPRADVDSLDVFHKMHDAYLTALPKWRSAKEEKPVTGRPVAIVWGDTVQTVAYRRVGRGFACELGYEWETVADLECDSIPDDQVTYWQPWLEPPEAA